MASKAPERTSSLATRHVLIVEDSYDLVLLIEEFLGIQGGYEVAAARDLSAMARMIRERDYDIVLLDYRLPDGTGLDAMRMLRELRATAPVIMITGQGDEKVAVQALKAGASDYLVKSSNYMATLPQIIERTIEQKKLQQAVAAAEARYQYLFDQASDGILVCDLDGQIFDANQIACRWLQTARNEIVKYKLTDFENTDRIEETHRRSTLADQEELLYTAEYIRPDGSRFPAEVSARQVQHHEHIYLQYFIRDITLRREMEKEIMRRSRELAALSEVTAAINRSLELDEVLHAGLDGLEEALQSDWAAVLIRDADGEFYLSAARGLATSQIQPGEKQSVAALPETVAWLQPQQRPAWLTDVPCIHFQSIPLFVQDSAQGFILLGYCEPQVQTGDQANLARVIGDRISAAIENARLLRELQQSLDAIRGAQAQLLHAARLSAVGELAAGVAHQINNPLTTIIADAQLLLKSIEPGHPGYESADAICQAGWRAQQVVQRLLKFAAPDDAPPKPTQVNDTVVAALDLVGAYLERSGVKLELVLASDLPPVLASGQQLEEMWVNLLLNAQAALEGVAAPVVGMTTSHVPELESVIVEIKDNGSGISSDNIDLIFEPFFTTKSRNKGTGLGLSVCQTIAQHHGGKIAVYSTLGEGATFTVSLPA